MNVESGDKFQFTDSVIFCKEHIGEGKSPYHIERIICKSFKLYHYHNIKIISGLNQSSTSTIEDEKYPDSGESPGPSDFGDFEKNELGKLDSKAKRRGPRTTIKARVFVILI